MNKLKGILLISPFCILLIGGITAICFYLPKEGLVVLGEGIMGGIILCVVLYLLKKGLDRF